MNTVKYAVISSYWLCAQAALAGAADPGCSSPFDNEACAMLTAAMVTPPLLAAGAVTGLLHIRHRRQGLTEGRAYHGFTIGSALASCGVSWFGLRYGFLGVSLLAGLTQLALLSGYAAWARARRKKEIARWERSI